MISLNSNFAPLSISKVGVGDSTRVIFWKRWKVERCAIRSSKTSSGFDLQFRLGCCGRHSVTSFRVFWCGSFPRSFWFGHSFKHLAVSCVYCCRVSEYQRTVRNQHDVAPVLIYSPVWFLVFLCRQSPCLAYSGVVHFLVRFGSLILSSICRLLTIDRQRGFCNTQMTESIKRLLAVSAVWIVRPVLRPTKSQISGRKETRPEICGVIGGVREGCPTRLAVSASGSIYETLIFTIWNGRKSNEILDFGKWEWARKTRGE